MTVTAKYVGFAPRTIPIGIKSSIATTTATVQHRILARLFISFSSSYLSVRHVRTHDAAPTNRSGSIAGVHGSHILIFSRIRPESPQKGGVLLGLRRQKAGCARRASSSSGYICHLWGNSEQIDFVRNWVQF